MEVGSQGGEGGKSETRCWFGSAQGPIDDFPESIRSILVFLIQLPTVTHLDIDDIIGFPVSALSGCSNLIDLKLGKLELAPTEVNQVIKPRSRSLLRSGFLTRYWPG